MISARSFDPEMGYAGLLMRADEYLALGPTSERYELINGVVVISPSPRPRHWTVVGIVLRQFQDYERRMGVPDGYESYSEIDVFIDDLTVYRPDFCAYARPRPAEDPARISTPPDLVLEVLSPGGKSLDLVTKRNAYEQFGVREYWTIDPDDADGVRAWARRDGRFVDVPISGAALASTAFPGFVLDLAPIRARTARQ